MSSSESHGGRRQVTLHVQNPIEVEPLGLAVGGARGKVGIGDHHVARRQPRVEPRPVLVAVGDVEQLQDVAR